MMLQFGIPELPERISVETCLIGREAARLQNLEAFDLTTVISANISGTNTPINQLQAVEPSKQKSLKKFTDTEMNTDGPNPMRDRELQTEQIQPVSIGIQCCLEDELDEAEFKNALIQGEASIENFDDLKKRFIEFIKEKTKHLGNGKFECIMCGEIKASAKQLAAHMAMHWGPPKLCYRCGAQFEHAVSFKKHFCVEKRPKRRFYIKCPHYSCNVNAISPAELFDHLNEHCGLRPHRCGNCKKGFSTFDELRLHRKLHRKCLRSPMRDIYALPREDTLHRKRVLILKTAEGKRVVVKFFLTQISNRKQRITHMCHVCLKRCKNVLHQQKHSNNCLNQHKRRLKWKREFVFGNATTNGHNFNGI